MVLKLTRKQYADLFGASKGDKIRLGDTDIIIEVEKDLISPGDECVFGGGKTIRDGLAQASGVTNANGALDYVITNAVVLDPMVGIVKGDIGIKDGKIAGIGKGQRYLKHDSFCLYRSYCWRAYNMYTRTLGYPCSYDFSTTIHGCN